LKQIAIVLIFILLLLSLCACALEDYLGYDPPELTQEQSTMIARYAAGTLIRRSKHFSGRLVDPQKAALPDPAAEEAGLAKENDPIGDSEDLASASSGQTEDAQDQGNVSAGSSDDAMPAVSSFGELLDIENLSLEFYGTVVNREYPNPDEGEVLIGVTANAGDVIMAFSFMLINDSDRDVKISMPSANMKTMLKLNDALDAVALNTLLPDDLTTLNTTIPALSGCPVVLLLEVPENTANNVNSVELVMTKGKVNYRLQLY